MSSPPRPVVFAGYDPTSIDLMADILRRATGNRAIDTAALEVALVAVVHATGIGRQDTEAAALWYEGESDSHLEIARQYMSIANAPNPLDPSVCTTAVHRGGPSGRDPDRMAECAG